MGFDIFQGKKYDLFEPAKKDNVKILELSFAPYYLNKRVKYDTIDDLLILISKSMKKANNDFDIFSGIIISAISENILDNDFIKNLIDLK